MKKLLSILSPRTRTISLSITLLWMGSFSRPKEKINFHRTKSSNNYFWLHKIRLKSTHKSQQSKGLPHHIFSIIRANLTNYSASSLYLPLQVSNSSIRTTAEVSTKWVKSQLMMLRGEVSKSTKQARKTVLSLTFTIGHSRPQEQEGPKGLEILGTQLFSQEDLKKV